MGANGVDGALTIGNAIAGRPVWPGVVDHRLAAVGVIPAIFGKARLRRVMNQVGGVLHDNRPQRRWPWPTGAEGVMILLGHQRQNASDRRGCHRGAALGNVALAVVVSRIATTNAYDIGFQATIPGGAAAAALAQVQIVLRFHPADHQQVLSRTGDGKVTGGVTILTAGARIAGGFDHLVGWHRRAAIAAIATNKLVEQLGVGVVGATGLILGTVADFSAMIIDGIVKVSRGAVAVGGQAHARGHATHLEGGATTGIGAVADTVRPAGADDAGHMGAVTAAVIHGAQEATGKVVVTVARRVVGVDARIKDRHLHAATIQPGVEDRRAVDAGCLRRIDIHFGAGRVIFR